MTPPEATLHSAQHDRPVARIALALLWIALGLLLLVPTELAMRQEIDGEVRSLRHLLSLFGTLAAMAAVVALLPARLGALMLGTGVAVMVLLRLSYLGLVQFSGHGFTDEVFIHLEPQSFRVAWMEYPLLCLAAIGLCVGMFAATHWLAGAQRRLGTAAALVLLFCALPAFWLGRAGSPEWKALRAAQSWYATKPTDLSPERMERWLRSDLITLDPLPKSLLLTHTPERPPDLIFLYLESIGLSILQHPAWPDLMPNLQALVRDHAALDHLHTSAYITIEGLVNSQCGTLFPFERDNQSLAGFDGLAEQLPCLGDILAHAGYQQSFLGGASHRFAGKGAFLKAHGFDRVMGLDEWRLEGLEQRPDTWGLSDADLFEQSLLEIERLRAEHRPFHLSLLTIGTHLPGYAYEECAPYPHHDDRFLHALHCTDQLLGRWINALREQGALEHAMLVLTADHHVFPNPDMVRLFGEEAVRDRRLPLVLLGRASQRVLATRSGASYDLAPTLLDLLGIEHNARFPLGRSLASPLAPNRPLLTRYLAVNDDTMADVEGDRCNDTVESSVPVRIDVCAREELLTLLRSQNARFSRAETVIACNGTDDLRVELPHETEADIRIMLGGEDHSRRFTWQERSLLSAREGLFLAAFDASGKLLKRIHAPAALAALDQQVSASLDGADLLLAVWRASDGERFRPPDWLERIASPASAGAWLIDWPSRRVLQSDQPADPAAGRLLQLDTQLCRNHYGR